MSRMLMVYQFHANESFELVTFHCLFCWLIHISLPLFVDSLFMLEIFNLYVKFLSGCIYWTEETVLELFEYGAMVLLFVDSSFFLLCTKHLSFFFMWCLLVWERLELYGRIGIMQRKFLILTIKTALSECSLVELVLS